MLSALWSLAFAGPVAPVAEPVPAGAFEIRVGAVTARIEAVAAPLATGSAAVCPFILAAQSTGPTLTRHATCPEALAADVDDALGAWKVAVSGVTTPVELAELWWVFPVGINQPVRLFVRPQTGRDVIVRTPAADVLPWSLTAQVPLEYPPAALNTDTTSNTCLARVGVDPTGFPETIEVSACDAVFADALAAGLNRWRFGGGGTLDGRPFTSGLTLRARYVAGVSGGHVEVELPDAPDRGDRPATVAAPEPWKAPPEPTGDPLFVIDHKSFAQVRIFDMVLPEVSAMDGERRCDLLLQVNSARRVWGWSEACDPSVRQASEEAASSWTLVAGQIERGESLARFRTTFVFPPGQRTPEVWIPADDLVGNRSKLPDTVHTQRTAKAILTVPPKLPRQLGDLPPGETVCEYAVTVGVDGRPREVEPVEGTVCPEAVSASARKAVKKWRWAPAESDGRPIESQVVARLRVEGA